MSVAAFELFLFHARIITRQEGGECLNREETELDFIAVGVGRLSCWSQFEEVLEVLPHGEFFGAGMRLASWSRISGYRDMKELTGHAYFHGFRPGISGGGGFPG